MMRKARKLVWAMLFLLMLVMLSVLRVSAQEAGDPAVIDEAAIPALPQFLDFVASPPGAVIVGVVVSMYLARWQWYNAQSGETKKLIAYGLTAVVAIGAYLLVTYVPAAFWEEAEAIWVILVFTAFAVFGNQGWFQLAIKRAQAGDETNPLSSPPDRRWMMIGGDTEPVGPMTMTQSDKVA